MLFFICYPQTLSERCGAVAQLGERMNGIHEVEGSIPFGSTSNNLRSSFTSLKLYHRNQIIRLQAFVN